MKVLLFANTDWYLYNFRLPLAKAIQSRGDEVVLVSPPGAYAERLVGQGFRWVPFSVSRQDINPIRELMAIKRLAALYRIERPDLVHHFTIKCVLYGSLAAHLTGIRSVVNSVTGLGHVFTDNGLSAKVVRPIVRLLYELALKKTRVIFQNPDDFQLFKSLGLVVNEQAHLIRGSGVDIEHFVPVENSVTKERRHVLFASRLLWVKGMKEYVEAAERVRGDMPDAVFLVAGETDPGNPAAVPESMIAEWKRSGIVRILGHLDDMKSQLMQADIVVLPSYREGLPRILLEAAACGLPLVATDVPGCREIVKHGRNGLLVPVRNSVALAEAINTLLKDDELRIKMGLESRRIVCEELSQGRVIKETLEVYEAAEAGVPQ